MAINLAWHIAIILIGCVFIGIIFDKYLNTKPLGIVVFSVLGIAGSLYHIIKEGLKKWM